MRIILLLVLSFSLIFSSCNQEGNEELQTGSMGLNLTVVSGDGQVLENPGELSGEVSVIVKNDNGEPLSSVNLNFSLLDESSSGAKLLNPMGVTDSKGQFGFKIISADFIKTSFFKVDLLIF